MQRLFSLDLMNKETFDSDIVTESGKLLYCEGEQVTPDAVLKLYFKEIYSTQETQIVTEQVEAEAPAIDEQRPAKRVFNPEQFDEEHAKNVAYQASKIAKLMHLPSEETTFLRDAAYNHDIGKALLTKEEFEQKPDKILISQLGSTYLLQEKKAAQFVAEAVMRASECYSPEDFELKKGTSNSALFNIIALADFYTNMKEAGKTKDEIIKTMLKLGNSRFNIFMLHKYLYKLRNENE